jgi:hypothetical protein
MSDGQYFLALASTIPDTMLYFLPITLTVAGVWIWGLIATGRLIREQTARLAARCVLPAAFTVGVLVVGVVFCHRGPPPWAGGDPPAFPEYLIDGLVLAHLPLAGLLLWRSRGQWPVVAASSGMWAWASVCASMIAYMSVSGVWL